MPKRPATSNEYPHKKHQAQTSNVKNREVLDMRTGTNGGVYVLLRHHHTGLKYWKRLR